MSQEITDELIALLREAIELYRFGEMEEAAGGAWFNKAIAALERIEVDT
jgi:hypothetical protein